MLARVLYTDRLALIFFCRVLLHSGLIDRFFTSYSLESINKAYSYCKKTKQKTRITYTSYGIYARPAAVSPMSDAVILV